MTYSTLNYAQQGGAVWVIGGELQMLAGSRITVAGTQATAIADLAGSIGTANDTMTAIAAPTDTPATADALRDDIAANMVPAINNNLADLQAKVNAILAALRGVGIVAS